ncbi:MAG TPA: asparagine synthase (glutamine-hydrolyzing) [Planctomycetota bacterium]|nr:asparagine synthase (glutamine-hydrolyzing) [Planctomycetota bacterium]
MCGISGIFNLDRQRLVSEEPLKAMANAMIHRGPDGHGYRTGPGYGLAHRRLSIVDLESGAQPMTDDRQELWVTFNGEIYNFLDLRAELEALGHRFHTRCDTEVLLHGYRAFGKDLPKRLRGMFAFAIVDERNHTLFAARDRLGKKPFHYALTTSGLSFASELKSILALGMNRRIDTTALTQFLCLRYVPDPLTIFQGIQKLPPGCSMFVDERGRVHIEHYWELTFGTPSEQTEEELAEQILAHLDEATRIRLMGDVPLGAFLSGGVDSFAVVESMSRSLKTPVVACTVGFDDPKFDERAYARQAAKAVGANLHEELLSLSDLEDLAWFENTFDEPFSDASALPTYHVSRLARKHVTVALSGDGGDESFAGYRRYKFDMAENRMRNFVPRFFARTMGAIYPKADWLPQVLRAKRTLQNLGLPPEEAYARSVSANLPDEILPLCRFDTRGLDPLSPIKLAWQQSDGPDPLSRACAADLKTNLAGDILVKVDRTSMAVSLEVRAPFLDHVLMEAAARIPSSLKLKDGQMKGFLRRALEPRLGAQVMQRKKQGFSVPLARWFREGLGDRLETELASEKLNAFLDGNLLRQRLREHRSSRHNHAEILWASFALCRFLDRWA